MSELSDRLSAAVDAVATAESSGNISTATKTNLTRWLTSSAFAEYHDRLVSLVEANDWATLSDAYWEVIPFGTGGRRGTMGEFGSATVNARTIAESADGLATYLKRVRGDASGSPVGTAVIAHDTRNRSAEFAKLTATTLAAHGLKVYLFDDFRSTPALSFSVRHLNCDVGAMISASHNPPSDNGFKAYWSSGGQVLPPHDVGIIECVESADVIPTVDFDDAIASGAIEIIGEEVDNAYQEAVLACSLSKQRDVSAVFTPLHGVGETSAFETLKRAGFDQATIFEPQREPNGNFPNVPDQLPNPERPEVFGPAIEEAKKTGADLVLASDPDADRLGVNVRDASGEYVHLTGNQVGALLCDYVLTHNTDRSGGEYVVHTLVTTPLVGTVAKANGVDVVDDLLVGFKYIGQTMDNRGPEKFLFGTEESLGYLSGQYARDKDASIATLYVMEMAAELKAQGKTLLDRLDELYALHGYHWEGQTSKVCPGPTGRDQILGLMNAFRNNPPLELGGLKCALVRDYQTHEVRSLPENTKTSDLPEPTGNLLFLETDPEASPKVSIAVRPSGTEPKIKFYYFAVAPTDANCLPETKASVRETMTAVQKSLADWMQGTLDSMG